MLCSQRLAEKFDEIQCKNFPKVRKAYFLSLYRFNIPTVVCTPVAVMHPTTDSKATGSTPAVGRLYLRFFLFHKKIVFKDDFNAIKRQ